LTGGRELAGANRTFSLLPNCLAARLLGLLAAIEVSFAAASSFKSMEAATMQPEFRT